MKEIGIMMMCECEDFPCCDCGQEFLAEQRWFESGGYADFRDPYDDDREYFYMMECIADAWDEHEREWLEKFDD